ncbi:MAG TPA: homoserine kinase [Acidobacteriaceae bacterium]|nr:homoserine kinase [Acidobacteriaceae bacterium]
MPGGLHLKLPATSANLGPGFDTLALALDVHLEMWAREAAKFSIRAEGRSPEVCGALERNLLLDVYRKTLAAKGLEAKPLSLDVKNGIPLGMGCGSSAAVRLAGVTLASHFGGLNWTREEILAEATRLEGHPDNTAACWLGGFVAGSWDGETLHAVSFSPPTEWRAMIVLPEKPLSTASSRAVLPESYSRADVVANLQRVAVLTGAFASGRGSLIADAMKDRMHQPYRSEVCPLLLKLLPLAGLDGILGVALSGAGPAVLVLMESEQWSKKVKAHILNALHEAEPVEVLQCELEHTGGQSLDYE